MLVGTAVVRPDVLTQLWACRLGRALDVRENLTTFAACRPDEPCAASLVVRMLMSTGILSRRDRWNETGMRE